MINGIQTNLFVYQDSIRDSSYVRNERSILKSRQEIVIDIPNYSKSESVSDVEDALLNVADSLYLFEPNEMSKELSTFFNYIVAVFKEKHPEGQVTVVCIPKEKSNLLKRPDFPQMVYALIVLFIIRAIMVFFFN